jgi:hypothetical protein
MLNPETIQLDDIAATLEMFEIIPQNPKPQPGFWAEVLELADKIDETIEVWSIERCEVDVLEMLCHLRRTADDLRLRCTQNLQGKEI